MHPSHNSQPYKYLFFHFCMLFQMVESNHTYHYIDILNSSLKKKKRNQENQLGCTFDIILNQI